MTTRTVSFAAAVPHWADDAYLTMVRTQAKEEMTRVAANDGRKLTGAVTTRTSQEMLTADGTLLTDAAPRDTYVIFTWDTTPANQPHED